MSRPLRIGVTGGIGSGKSLVCQIFSVLGVPIYDADSRAKHLMNTDADLKEQITEAFGKEAFAVDGQINRGYLARVVFAKPELLAKLNGFVHPCVATDFSDWVKQHNHASYVVKEAALLFESGSYTALDEVVLVMAPEELRIRRVLQRDGHRKEDDIRNIIRSQMPEEEKFKLARYFITNDESKLVVPQVLRLHEQFQK